MMPLLKQNIVTLVRQKGWPISKIERDAGLTKNYLSNLLRDKSKNPGLDGISKIARALGVSIDELFGNKTKYSTEYKNHHYQITRGDIFDATVKYFLSKIKLETNKSLEFGKIIDALYEIYVFSLKSGSMNKDFADWYITNNF